MKVLYCIEDTTPEWIMSAVLNWVYSMPYPAPADTDGLGLQAHAFAFVHCIARSINLSHRSDRSP